VLTPPEYRMMEEEKLSELRQTKEHARYEKEYIRKNGSRVPIDLSVQPFLDDKGDVIGYFAFITDITERKRIAQALAESEAKFRAGFLQASVGMSMLSVKGVYLNVNDALCKMLGYSREELVGKSPFDITYPDDVELTRQNIETATNLPSTTQHYEKRFVKKDGQILWVLIDNTAVTDEKGEVLYMLAQAQDITARKEAEERLQLQTKVLVSMNQILEETISTENEEQFGKKVLEIVRDLTESQIGLIDEIGEDSSLRNVTIDGIGRTEGQTPGGYNDGLQGNARFTGFMKQILNDGKFVIINNFENSPNKRGAPEGHPFIKSFLGFPVMLNGNAVAFVGLANKKDGKYTEKDRQIAEMLSTPIAEAINRFRIKNKLSEQRALQKSEERFRGIAERSFDAIVTTDTDGKVTYCSSSIDKIFGFYPEEMLNKTITDLDRSITKEDFLKELSRLKQNGQIEIFNFQSAKKDGTPVYIEGNACPILKNDKVVGYQAILRDVSAKIKAQEDLQSSEEKYRELFESSPIGILDIDLSDLLSPIIRIDSTEIGQLKSLLENPASRSLFSEKIKINDANRAAMKLFEVDSLDKLASSISIFLTEPDARPSHASIIKTLTNNYVDFMNGREVEIEVVTSRGKKIMLSLRVSIFALNEKKPRAIITMSDVTERYELLKMKDQFISSITHELRTPLLSIVGYLDFIISEGNATFTQETMEQLGIVMRNSLRLKNLTDDLLDLSRIDAGRFELKIENVDFKEVLGQCIAEASKILQTKPHFIQASVPDDKLLVRCDKIRLTQIMMNLLSNAIKYSPEGGRIGLNVSVSDGNLRVETTDEGIGIAKGNLNKVFERFATIQKPIYAKGTGLGLSVTKELVEAHGGKIWAESVGEGKGSTFIFILPLSRS
jgi:PAS domain S-box-containing protein